MVKESLIVKVEPGSMLARVLADADDRSVVLDNDGIRYTVSREDIFAHYDPERVRAALRASAGALEGVDTDALKRELRAQRGQDSHGRPA